MDFFAFDKAYVDKLRDGDPETESHFVAYFGRFLRIRMRARRLAADAIDDVVQDTLLRVMRKVHEGGVRQPECFGSFVNSVCKYRLQEHYRSSKKEQSMDDVHAVEVVDKVLDLEGLLITQETAKCVRRILEEMPERDRMILQRLFFDDMDKDAICAEFGIDRDYLRVLVHRALDKFRVLYKKDRNGKR